MTLRPIGFEFTEERIDWGSTDNRPRVMRYRVVEHVEVLDRAGFPIVAERIEPLEMWVKEET